MIVKSFKQSKIIRNWENVPLSDLAHIDTLKTLKNTDPKSLIHIGLEHIISNSNIIKGHADVQKVKTYRLFQHGDILYGRLAPHLNKVWLASMDGHCSTDILPIVANPNKILPKFLLYAMSSPQFVWKATMASSGVIMPRVRWRDLQKFDIPLPPVKEQRHIVAKIESIFAEIDSEMKKAQRPLIDKSAISTLFQDIRISVLTRMFEQISGSRNKSIGDVCYVLQANNARKTPSSHTPSIHIGLEHIISHANEIRGHGVPGNFKTSREFFKNNILYGRLRPELNKVWLATEEGQCSTDILPLVVKPMHILPKFLLYALSTQKFVTYAISRSSGTKMPRIRWREIETFQIPAPTLTEQRRVVERIESIFAKIDSSIFGANALQRASFTRRKISQLTGTSLIDMLVSLCAVCVIVRMLKN